jgi:1-acyl-sn-glycerol-3-phosphate acyltransferase
VTDEAPAPDEKRTPPEAKPGLDFPTAWARTPLARWVRAALQDGIIVPLVWLCAPSTRRGTGPLGHIDGRFVIASNHQSHADTSVIVAALPRRLRRRLVVAAASDLFFSSWPRAVFAALVYNAIPIERNRVERRSAALARELVEEGWGLLIYPEGHRSEDGRLLEFKGGAAFLADRTDAQVVPCYLENTRMILPRLFAKLPDSDDPRDARRRGPQLSRLRTPVSVNFGPPIEPAEGETVRRFGRRIEGAVTHLGRDVAGDPLAGYPDATD